MQFVRSRIGFYLAVPSLILAFGATHVSALTNAELRCQRAIASQSTKFADRTLRARQDCQFRIMKGEISPVTDCIEGDGDQSTVDDIVRAENKLSGALPRRCDGMDLTMLGFPGVCAGGAGIFTVSDLEDCIKRVMNENAEDLLNYEYPPLPGATENPDRSCIHRVGRRSSKMATRELRARQKCLATDAKAPIFGGLQCRKLIVPEGPGTGDARTDRAILRAQIALLSGIPEGCTAVNVHELGYTDHCMDPDGEPFNILDLKICEFDQHRFAVSQMLEVSYPSPPECGNGVLEDVEECDDGNVSENDICLNDCTLATCGDDKACTEPGCTTGPGGGPEECDDGNASDGDPCLNDCSSATCGDSEICTDASCITGPAGGPEDCDDGNASDNDACLSDCADAFCGDGVLHFGMEDCDDGNTMDTDPCRNNCTLAECGDSVVCVDSACTTGPGGSREQCDDGNDSNLDICLNDCGLFSCGDGFVNPGFEECDPPGGGCDESCQIEGICGDGTVGINEDCDDGNQTNGDGCDDDVASGGNCTVSGCGNGVVAGAEQCDDSGESATCDADCTTASCGDSTLNATAGEQCDDGGESATCNTDCTTASCGDSKVNATAGEQCDTGGESAACDADCTTASCGDSTVNATAGEQCDDGGESATCDADCTTASCGDSAVNATAGEQCDDGGESATCNADCTTASCGDSTVNATAGEDCDDGGESATCDDDCTDAQCGDDNLNTTAGEACDDGNASDNDNCTNACQIASCGDASVCSDGACTSGPGGGPETCDDGGESATCDSDCSDAQCGDSTINAAAGETCDDGAPSDSGPCRADCTDAICGDGLVCSDVSCTTGGSGGPEDCDDAGESALCDDDCTAPMCGDGNLNEASGEACDDGNTDPGDGCSELCSLGQDPQCPDFGLLNIFAGTGLECASNADCKGPGTCDTSIGRCRTLSELDTGWKGIAHNADISEDVLLAGRLLCKGPGPTCGECEVTGLDPSPGNCRCSQENTNKCDEPFAEFDTDDCGTGLVCADDDDCRRCTNDPSTICTGKEDCNTVCATNSDCGIANRCACIAGQCGDCVCAAGAFGSCNTAIGECAGSCDCFFGAPLPLSAGNAPACVINKFREDVFGQANVDEGSGSITANLASIVHLGASLFEPCPSCGGTCTAPVEGRCTSPFVNRFNVCSQDSDCDSSPGNGVCQFTFGSPCVLDQSCDVNRGDGEGVCGNFDTTIRDGVAEGTCVGGKNDSESCDVDNLHTSFPAFNGFNGAGYSIDCLPAAGQNISGGGLVINLTQTTSSVQLAGQVDCGSPFSAPDDPIDPFQNNCMCRVCTRLCSGNSAIECENDTNCQACSLDNSITCGTNLDCQFCSGDTSKPCLSNFQCFGAGTCEPVAGTCEPAFGTCTDGEANLPCNSDQDCADAGSPGRCASNGQGIPPGPNFCSSAMADGGDGKVGLCVDQGDNEGECFSSTDDVNFCDGIVRANGEGFLSCTPTPKCSTIPNQGCNNNSDCAGNSSPGECVTSLDCLASGQAGGDCTQTVRKRCFLDPMTAQGVPDPNTPLGAATFCIPPTSGPAINIAAGLPGPGRVKTHAEATTFCASDRNVQYQPGVGGCPVP